jgi:Fe-S-cluster formation regulator IscX/YfhJ
MRRLHVILLGLCAVAVGTRFVLDSDGAQKPTDGLGASLPTDTVSAGTREEGRSSEATPLGDDHERAREPVSATTEEPCASVVAELQAERAAREAAEHEAATLRRELAALTRELDACRFPESTPYGAFLASPEADEIIESIRSGSHLYEATLDDLRADLQRYELRVATDPSVHNTHMVESLSKRLQLFSDDREAAVEDVLGSVKAWLDEFPVMLQPGEATWITEQVVLGPSGEDDLVRFLGLTRVAAELPLDMLFDDYLWDEDYGLQLQAALPPEKRTELAAKLDALMEQTDDPEEIEWLLERFPTLFD